MGFFTGTEDRFETRDRFDPQRGQAFNQILQQALAGLQANKADFAPIAERETRRFQQETVPSLAERFTSMGAGSQGSSGFAESLARGGTDLGTNLAAMGSQHGLAQQSQLMQLLGMGLTPQQEDIFIPGQQGFLGAMAPSLGQGLGMGLTGGLGGGGLIGMLLSLLGGGQQQQSPSGSVTYRR